MGQCRLNVCDGDWTGVIRLDVICKELVHYIPKIHPWNILLEELFVLLE